MEIHILIRYAAGGFPPPEVLAVRHNLEDLICAWQVGEIVGAGAGLGVMDLYVQVADLDAALPRLRALVRECGIEPATTIRVTGTQAA